MSDMIITIGIIAYNEENFINSIMMDVYHQTYNLKNIELILVDGKSTDKTKELMQEFKEKHQSEFYDIKVLDNEKQTQASGWNIIIKSFNGDALSRIDAHATIKEDFVERVVNRLSEGECIVGGPRTCVIDPITKWTKTLLQAENSLFGSSINASRRETKEKKYVKTMFHATYKREVFEKVGLFNENLKRTEDNELHYRMREKGYKFCFCPEIQSSQYARMSFKSMLHQKYSNGVWIGKTFKYNFKCLSVFYFAPISFLLAIIAALVLCCFGIWIPLVALASLYAMFAIANTVAVMVKEGFIIYQLLIPLMFLLLHLSYGAGTLVGLLSKNNFNNGVEDGTSK